MYQVLLRNNVCIMYDNGVEHHDLDAILPHEISKKVTCNTLFVCILNDMNVHCKVGFVP